ncbi:MAG: TraM recognition domain-containing protein, partial [Mucispirillum sp.]|nr:TraM recognition domain-containing protein [Mucispirillum sp.]
CVYIDEAQSMLYGGIDDVFAKAGGAGLWLHCFSQSVNQIYSAMPSKDAAKAIMDNTNTKLFMRAPDAETAESVAKFFGEKRTFSPVLSTNSGGMTIKENIDNLITPQHILKLKPREFFMTTYSGMYRGMVRAVSEHLLEIDYPEARSN